MVSSLIAMLITMLGEREMLARGVEGRALRSVELRLRRRAA